MGVASFQSHQTLSKTFLTVDPGSATLWDDLLALDHDIFFLNIVVCYHQSPTASKMGRVCSVSAAYRRRGFSPEGFLRQIMRHQKIRINTL